MSNEKPPFDPNKPFEHANEKGLNASDVKEDKSDAHSALTEAIEDVARGAAQGATADFADEAMAGLKAGGDVLADKLAGAGPEGEKSLSEYYNKHLPEERAAFKTSQERSPYLYGAGQVAGAVAPALATGGAGAAANAPKAAKLAEGLNATAESAKKLLPRLLNFGKAAAVEAPEAAAKGALYGGISAAGQNENPETLQQDINSGLESGAVAGPLLNTGLKAAGAGLGTLAQRAKRVLSGEYNKEGAPLVSHVGQAYQTGKAGKGLTESLADRQRMGAEQLGHATDITNKFIDAESKQGRELNNLVEAYSTPKTNPLEDQKNFEPLHKFNNAFNGLQQSLEDTIEQTPALRGLKETKTLGSLMSELNKAETPAQYYGVRNSLKELASKSKNEQIQQIAGDASDHVKDLLVQTVPGLEDAMDKFSQLRYAGSESLLSKGLPREFKKGYLSDLNAPKEKIAGAVTDMLSSLRMPGNSNQQSIRTYTEMMQNLAKLDRDHPGFLNKMGLNLPELERMIASKADQFAMQNQALGGSLQHAAEGLGKSGPNGLGGPLGAAGLGYAVGGPIGGVIGGGIGLALGGKGSGKSALLKGANLAGQAKRALSDSPPVRLTNKIYEQSGQQLRGLADTLKNSGNKSLAGTGEAIENAINNKDQVAKDAALFTLMGSPSSRKYVQSLFKKTENEDKNK